MNQKWKYLRTQVQDEEALNHIGSQGWELVAIEPMPADSKGPSALSGGSKPFYVFKQPADGQN